MSATGNGIMRRPRDPYVAALVGDISAVDGALPPEQSVTAVPSSVSEWMMNWQAVIPAAGTSGITPGRGHVLWRPWRDLESSAAVFGEYPAGETTAMTDGPAAVGGPDVVVTGVTGGLSPLAIPRDVQLVVPGDGQLGANYCRSRVTFGKLTARVTTKTAMPNWNTGLVSGVSLTDTSGVYGAATTPGEYAFSESLYPMVADVSKDVVQQRQARLGVSAVVGPDIPDLRRNAASSVQMCGAAAVAMSPVAGKWTFPLSAMGLPGPIDDFSSALASGFVGRWPGQHGVLANMFAPAPANFTQVSCGDASAEDGSFVLDAAVSIGLAGPMPDGEDGTARYEVVMHAQHLFMRIDSTGETRLSALPEEVRLANTFRVSALKNGSASVRGRLGVPVAALCSEGASLARIGKFLGTVWAVRLRQLASGDGWAGTTVTGSCVLTAVDSASWEGDGARGPARVLRWVNVDSGCVVQVNGVGKMQVVARGFVSSMVQGAVSHAAVAATPAEALAAANDFNDSGHPNLRRVF